MVIDVKFSEVANINKSESLKDDKWFKIRILSDDKYNEIWILKDGNWC